ncbi:MAG TPA: lipopolysaccharide heptosyltransferase family protein, partial [Firmicutes bacterium]|nr:lipopolysaccharide heptosyltransferase family protein [Bacillota bacterium]
MKVVILRTDRIGDLVLAEPLIEALHSIYTNICVDVVASEYAAPVL